MTGKMIPIFKSHYSLGKSILTLSDKEEEGGPKSGPILVKEYGLSSFCLLDEDMTGYLEAFQTCKKLDLHFIFGLRLLIEGASYNIFLKSSQGYQNMIKISNLSNRGELNWKNLKENWSDFLLFVVPFYDSYIYQNYLNRSIHVPDGKMVNKNTIYFIEDNDHPVDRRLSELVRAKTKNTQLVKTICYNKREDCKAYIVNRCIHNRSFSGRTCFDTPNLELFCSREFCFESFKEKTC